MKPRSLNQSSINLGFYSTEECPINFREEYTRERIKRKSPPTQEEFDIGLRVLEIDYLFERSSLWLS